MTAVTTSPADPVSRYAQWGTRIGIAGSVLVLFAASFSPALFALGLLLALAGCALNWRCVFAMLSGQAWAWATLVVLLWVLVRGAIDVIGAPTAYEAPGDDIWAHARFAGVVSIILGIWLATHWEYRWWFVGIVVAGLLVGFLYQGQWDRIGLYLDGARADFVQHPQDTAFVTAPVLLLVLGLSVRSFVGFLDRRSPTLGVLALLGIILAAGLFALIVLTQSRSAWIALAIFGPVCVAAWSLYLWRRPEALARRLVAAVVACAVIVPVAAGIFFSDILSRRLEQTTESVRSLNTGEQTGSIGVRYRLIEHGLSQVAEAPLAGIGPVAVRRVIPREMEDTFWIRHYHSTYLNLAVAIGVPGLLVWLGAHLVAAWRVLRHWALGAREPVFGWALIGMAGTVLAMSLFQVWIFRLPGAAVHVSLWALLFAAALKTPPAAEPRGESA